MKLNNNFGKTCVFAILTAVIIASGLNSSVLAAECNCMSAISVLDPQVSTTECSVFYFGEPHSQCVYQVPPQTGNYYYNFYCECITDGGLGLCEGRYERFEGSGPPYTAPADAGCKWDTGSSAPVDIFNYDDACQLISRYGC